MTLEKVEEMLEGKGVGRKNIDWLVEKYELDPTTTKDRLAKNSITATNEETFHDIADRYEVSPLDIIKVMMVEGHTI